ncbi:MAG: fatty acid desaturase [Candidatus Cybelea sp.]|jgi:stearoyl-CoA desaturase (delta-9 desaturase)
MDRTYSRIKGFGLIGIHIGALAAFWPGFFSWSALAAAAVVSYATVALGISLCFHRILTHRSLRLLKPIEYLFAIFGTLALQADPIRWVSVHRKHHAHADHEGDPHSIADGFKWAHMDWIYRHNIALPSVEEMRHFAPDLYSEPFYRVLQYLNIPLQLALGLGLFALGGWSWVIWGIFVRLALSYHTTWLVNSAAHMLGYRSYQTPDQSTNCWWVALISWGEGWHNNHHAFPFSARHGLRWFELDLTWWHVRVLAFLRLADRVKVPTKAMQQRLRDIARNGSRSSQSYVT